ncbi:unnamed protein product [Haemonchus placei]|uniref:Rib_recp_KP_reg domain-containing protein n=1 Tax=Haemonchus placei TaxID=6290 RepID=A0A158QR64_HAEPC|nr:unnamed protein product [Haemonchus placei]
MRNLPLFVFLAGLVFFFYLFYLHQSQSAEYAIAQASLDDHKQQLRVLKLDLLNANADVERLKSSESSLKEERDKLSREKDKCSVSLRSAERERENLKSEISKKASENSELSTKLEEAKKELEELKKAIAAKEAAEKENKETSPKPTVAGESAVGGHVDESAKGGHGRNYEADGGSAKGKSLGNIETGGGASKAVEQSQAEQAPAPVPNIVEGVQNSMFKKTVEGVLKKSLENELVKKDDMPAQVGQPPQHPGDRVKLAVAVDEQQEQEHVVAKPIVRGGDYEDKLDVEKGIGDDIQPA